MECTVGIVLRDMEMQSTLTLWILEVKVISDLIKVISDLCQNLVVLNSLRLFPQTMVS